MNLGIMQPYFLPYIGYFQLINAVDKYIIYDDVQFIKGGWINRNNILLNGDKFMFNLILNGASTNKLINEITVSTNQSKLLKTIENSYKKAICFEKVFPIVISIFKYNDKNLAKFIGNSIVEVCNYLNLNTEIIYSSELNKNNNSKGQDRIVSICELLKADIYINAIGGQKLYNKETFKSSNIDLKFLKSNLICYPQFTNEFVPFLSILDIMMFNSIEKIKSILDNFELI